MQNIEQVARERAYQLWIEGGCLGGQADAHCQVAPRKILSTLIGELGRVADAGRRRYFVKKTTRT